MTTYNDSFLRVAKIGRTIGLKGELALWPISNVDERYMVGSVLVDKDSNEYEISKIRQQKEQYVVKFVGYETIEAAEPLVNVELFGEPLDETVLNEGEFFAHDVLDKTIKETDGTERGVIKDVIPNAASDLLENENGDLVPFRFITHFDDKYVYIDAPEGLFDLGE